jgi:hypothetical protein
LPTEPLPPPPPSSDGGCGGFVQFLAMVVAIVVSAVIIYASMGTATPAVTGFWGSVGMGAVAGAAGAAASQVVLIAGGQQDGFDWKGVAMAAVGGAVTAGVTQGMPMTDSSAFVRGFAQGAVGSVVTQGVEVATGLQSHFDWRGVAASAIAQGVGSQVGQTEIGQNQSYGKIVSGLAAGGASAVVRGGSIQNQMSGILHDVMASTIGNAVADQMIGASTRPIDFESAARQYEADMANGRMQLLVDNTPAKNSPDRLLNGPSSMSTDDDDDGIEDAWQKVAITEKRLTGLEKLASYAQDVKDFLSTPDYNQLSDQQLARLPVSNFAANREKVNRAAAQGTIPYTMSSVLNDFEYKTASAGVSAVVTAPVVAYVATRAGVGYLGGAITGGTAGGIFDTTQQLLDNAVHALSGGQVGRSGFSVSELGVSTFLGTAFGVGAKGVPEAWAWAKEKIGANSAAPFTERSVFASYPERSALQFNSVSEQVDFLSTHVPGLSQSQATSILDNGFSRDTSVVLGGSRIRGNFNDLSDLDVGFGNLSERQAQRVIKSINEQGFDVPLERLTIVPGKSTATIKPIISPEEFFQRSGIRAGGDLRAGQSYVPSGSITLTKDGRIVLIPPGKL